MSMLTRPTSAPHLKQSIHTAPFAMARSSPETIRERSRERWGPRQRRDTEMGKHSTNM